MSGVHSDNIHSEFEHLRNPLGIVSYADRAAHAQPSEFVLARIGIFDLLLDILDRDQTAQGISLVNDQQFLYLILLQYLLRVVKGRADGSSNEAVLGHYLRHREIHPGLKPEIAVRQDAHEFFSRRDRDTGNPVLLHEFQCLGDLRLGSDRDRVDDHSALGLLHLVHFPCLHINGQRLVNKAEPAFLRESNGQSGLGHGIHRRAHKRNIQSYLFCEMGADTDVLWQNI